MKVHRILFKYFYLSIWPLNWPTLDVETHQPILNCVVGTFCYLYHYIIGLIRIVWISLILKFEKSLRQQERNKSIFFFFQKILVKRLSIKN